MKKTYEAGTWQGFKMGLNVRGKPTVINFDPGTAEPVLKNNRFTTNDPEIQKEIEATKHFRIKKVKCISALEEELSEGIEDVSIGDKPKPIDPKTHKVIDNTKSSKTEKPELKVLKYKSWQPVGSWLENNRGVDPSLLSTPTDIEKVAKEQNLSLPNLG